MQATMPRPPSENTFQVTFKIPEAWIAQADEIAAAMSRPGLTITRTDALRTALARGLTDTQRVLRENPNAFGLSTAVAVEMSRKPPTRGKR